MRTLINEDLEDINKWLIARGKKALKSFEVPPYGMIEDGVGCGFVVIAEPTTAFIEAIITNPEADSKEREVFIRKLINWSVSFATSTNCTKILALTNEPNLIQRSYEHGADVSQITILKKDL